MDDRQAELRFVPAVLTPEPPDLARDEARVRPPRPSAFAGIEVAVASATVRVGPDAREAQIAAVIRALKTPA